jgi:hypothetical protein
MASASSSKSIQAPTKWILALCHEREVEQQGLEVREVVGQHGQAVDDRGAAQRQRFVTAGL